MVQEVRNSNKLGVLIRAGFGGSFLKNFCYRGGVPVRHPCAKRKSSHYVLLGKYCRKGASCVFELSVRTAGLVVNFLIDSYFHLCSVSSSSSDSMEKELELFSNQSIGIEEFEERLNKDVLDALGNQVMYNRSPNSRVSLSLLFRNSG